MESLIVPAVIAKSQSKLEEMLNRVTGKVRRVQLDVMDGEFVPNTSLNFDFKLPTSSGLEFEAHLMVTNPLEWVKKNLEKVDLVTMHIETLKTVDSAVDYIKKKGGRVNLALIPETEVDTLQPYLDKIDGILVMTVEPGSYCVKKEFRPEPLDKIRKIRAIDRVIPIEVDGCMNPKNVKLARDAGANIFASGSYIFKSDNIARAIKELEAAIAA